MSGDKEQTNNIFLHVLSSRHFRSVELIRVFHSLWIDWDGKMYHVRSDTPAMSRTTALSEELGQIEYIFSDKTGTLTQNVMTFNKCTIGGRTYGDPTDAQGNTTNFQVFFQLSKKQCKTVVSFTQKPQPYDFSKSNNLADPKFEWSDGQLIDIIEKGDSSVDMFFRLLAICHTVMSERINDRLVYQAQSPDEAALVTAARNFGYIFMVSTF